MIIKQNWGGFNFSYLPEFATKHWLVIKNISEVCVINEHSVNKDLVGMKIPLIFNGFEHNLLHLPFTIIRKCNELFNCEKSRSMVSSFMEHTISQHSIKDLKLDVKCQIKKCSELLNLKKNKDNSNSSGNGAINKHSENSSQLDLKIHHLSNSKIKNSNNLSNFKKPRRIESSFMGDAINQPSKKDLKLNVKKMVAQAVKKCNKHTIISTQ